MKTAAQIKAAGYYNAQLARVREAIKDPESAKHGTLIAYNAGCRCEACRRYQSAYRRDLAKRRANVEA